MKRPAFSPRVLLVPLALLALVLPASAQQSSPTGFGINGSTGPVYSVGESELLTQRILTSSTAYRTTPGDTYELILILEGNEVTYPLVLQDSYELDVPYIGTVSAKGMMLSELRRTVMDGVRKAVRLATYVSFSLKKPAMFDVPVFGGVEVPGVVTVTPLSIVSDAIAAAKGIRKGGSYRNVKLQRGGKEIAVDLLAYNNGAGEGNPALEPGDRIVVPTAQVQVTLGGCVRYPGPYELLPGESLGLLIAYAGGLLPDAQADGVQIVHFAADGTQSTVKVDGQGDAGRELADGDIVRVPSVAENRDGVLVIGGLYGAPVTLDKPTAVPPQPITVTVPWLPGLSVLRLLENLGGPTPYARGADAVLIRKKTGERVLIDVDRLWTSRDFTRDIALEPGDTLTVPVVDAVFVTGEVRTPTRVAYQPSLTVADYLTAAGGINLATGSADAVFLVDVTGHRTRLRSTDTVKPGALILVDVNSWVNTQRTFTNITVVTGFVTAIVTLAGLLAGFYLNYIAP